MNYPLLCSLSPTASHIPSAATLPNLTIAPALWGSQNSSYQWGKCPNVIKISSSPVSPALGLQLQDPVWEEPGLGGQRWAWGRPRDAAKALFSPPFPPSHICPLHMCSWDLMPLPSPKSSQGPLLPWLPKTRIQLSFSPNNKNYNSNNCYNSLGTNYERNTSYTLAH